MQVEVGKIYEGKVSGITKFGAFVELAPKTSGLVHISEVSSKYVEDISERLAVGQQVKVKVLKIEDGKIGLSIKRAEEGFDENRKKHFKKPAGEKHTAHSQQQNHKPSAKPAAEITPVVFGDGTVVESSGDVAFEDMLSRFKAASEERMSDLKRVTENKRRSRRK